LLAPVSRKNTGVAVFFLACMAEKFYRRDDDPTLKSKDRQSIFGNKRFCFLGNWKNTTLRMSTSFHVALVGKFIDRGKPGC
jgi:hypothetical protein